MKTIKSKKSQITKGAKFLITFFMLSLFNSSVAQTDPYGDQHPETNPTSEPCLPGATSWYLGGNVLTSTQWGSTGPIGPLPENTAGTCNDYPFVLKANNNKSVFIMPSGRVGIGSSNPITNFEVRDLTNTDIFANSTLAYGTAGLWAMNGTTNYGLRIDNGGVGHLSQNVANPLDMLNFNWDASLVVPKAQVWIGKRPTAGSHINFDFAAPKIVANEIYVFVSGNWADYVFDKSYKLMPLIDVEKYIASNKHLPNIPSASEITDDGNGLNLGDMQKLQMEKIEELFLHVINQQKEIEELKKQNKALMEKNH